MGLSSSSAFATIALSLSCFFCSEYQGGQQNILLSESLSYRKDSHMQANKFRYYSQIGDKKEVPINIILKTLG